MSFMYTGGYMLPGQTAELTTFENVFYVDRYEKLIWESIVLSGAARDSGNTGNTTILRTGLLMGKITATGKIVEWTPTATDGSQYILGILAMNHLAQRMGTNQDRWIGHLVVGGCVKASRLIIPGSTTMGISGNANEHIIRAQMAPRFQFDDNWFGNNFGGWRDVAAVTADRTVTEAENNTLFTTRGAAGTVIFTLPVTPEKGLRYGFYCAAAQTMTITAGTADTLTAINDLTADSVSFSTAFLKIGGFIEVIGDGTSWLTIVHAGQTSDGTTSGQLVTVAT